MLINWFAYILNGLILHVFNWLMDWDVEQEWYEGGVVMQFVIKAAFPIYFANH